jgi:monoamine oxidase
VAGSRANRNPPIPSRAPSFSRRSCGANSARITNTITNRGYSSRPAAWTEPRVFQRELRSLIRFNPKLTAIKQDDRGVTAIYEDANRPGRTQSACADGCLWTIPRTILSQIAVDPISRLPERLNPHAYCHQKQGAKCD